ncbi:hypothetical protein VTH06DRAFT_1499 [Thermothelomyces fergusii]
MARPLFALPDEQRLAALSQKFPCREPQIRALSTLFYPGAAPCRNVVIHGTEATGKSAITAALLAELSRQSQDDGFVVRHAIVNSTECITARHLYETVVAKVADALAWDAAPPRCETVSQLAVELSKLLKYAPRPDGFRFVLVFDAIDRQRDAPHTLLPALARLSEIIPALTTAFIVTSPPPNFLLTSSVPHVHFPAYSKADFVAILSLSAPPALPNTTAQETADLWARFAAAVHDALARAACRTLPSFRHACTALWPRFTAPVHAGTHSAREFSKLLVAARLHFHDERLLDPGVLAVPSSATTTTTTTTIPPATTATTSTAAARPATHPAPSPSKPAAAPPGLAKTRAETSAGLALAALLPTTARLLLLAAYLASHNPTRHDQTLLHEMGARSASAISCAFWLMLAERIRWTALVMLFVFAWADGAAAMGSLGPHGPQGPQGPQGPHFALLSLRGCQRPEYGASPLPNGKPFCCCCCCWPGNWALRKPCPGSKSGNFSVSPWPAPPLFGSP